MPREPKPSPPSPAELIALIAERAPALIAAGVTSLKIGEFSVEMSRPTPPPAADPPPAPAVRGRSNPLDDPSTYPGGRVPGYSREDEPR